MVLFDLGPGLLSMSPHFRRVFLLEKVYGDIIFLLVGFVVFLSAKVSWIGC
jgi:hypothetical protein